MRKPLRQLEQRTRNGFTLVELLVVISILVILMVMATGAFTANDIDRVGNSISLFKNALQGAKSRAINSGEVRGLRLIPDPDNPKMVKSVVYVGSAGELIGELTIGGYNATTNRFQVTEAGGASDWGVLGDYQNGRQLIRQGTRIEIPADSGNWYTIFEAPDSNSDTNMIVSGFYQPSVWDGSNYVSQPIGADVTYRLALENTILDGAEPILLDDQTCIDLDGSRVPDAWRIVEDLDEDGVLEPGGMPAEPDIGSTGFTFSVGYRSNMDILFTPDGSLTGPVFSTGLLNLRFAYVSDVVLAEPLRDISGASPYTDFTGVPTYPDFIVPSDPEKDHKALTIFPQTGAVVVSEIDSTSPSPPTPNRSNNEIAAQPYSFARQGQESE